MISNFKIKTSIFFLLIFLIASCASPSIPAPSTETTIPVVANASATNIPLPTETPTVAVTFTPFPTPQPPLPRAQYTMDMQFNFSTNVAQVNQTIKYPNWTGQTLNDLVMAVEPNLWEGGFKLNSLAIDNQPVSTYTLDGQKLSVTLPQPLPASGLITITMSYQLSLPAMPAYSNPDDVRPQIYGWSDRQTNLVDWYPMVVPYEEGQGWVLYNPWFYGEHLVYDLADFDVTVSFPDGSQPKIAASGAEVDPANSVNHRFVLEAGRTFAMSMGLYYKVASQQVGDVTVYSYFFDFYDVS